MEIKDKLVEAIVKGIQEKKGQDITIADLRGIDGNIASYFVICQGNSPSQVEAIADSVCDGPHRGWRKAGTYSRSAAGLLGGNGLRGGYCAHLHTGSTRFLQP